MQIANKIYFALLVIMVSCCSTQKTPADACAFLWKHRFEDESILYRFDLLSEVAGINKRTQTEVKLIIQENNLLHAETLPGGKIVISTGFLDCMQYEAELAFVLAHEMGHVLGQHAERELALAGTPEGERGAQARRLRCELEADREGLLLMARAGYDPRVGLRFWQRFTSTPEAVLQQQLAGTHPSHEERMRALQSALPEVMQLYRRAEKQVGRGSRLRK